jgi:hypothetical protein
MQDQDDKSRPEQTSYTAIAKERGELPSSLIMSLFKGLYDFFGALLTILIIAYNILFVVLIAVYLLSGEVSYILSYLVTACFLFIFVVSIYYLVVGVFGLLFIKQKIEKENGLVKTKRMALRGIAGLVVLYLLYSLISATALLFFSTDIQGGFPRSLGN